MGIIFKPCPRCAERVKRDALICRHCSYEFTPADEANVASEEATLGAQMNADVAFLRKGCIGTVVVGLGILAVLMFAAVQRESGGSAGRQFTVTKAEAGDEWPYYSADVGIVRCEPGTRQITIELNGKKFGLNGKALGRGGFEPSQSQMRQDTDGVIYNTGPDEWIERGLALCDY